MCSEPISNTMGLKCCLFLIHRSLTHCLKGVSSFIVYYCSYYLKRKTASTESELDQHSNAELFIELFTLNLYELNCELVHGNDELAQHSSQQYAYITELCMISSNSFPVSVPTSAQIWSSAYFNCNLMLCWQGH